MKKSSPPFLISWKSVRHEKTKKNNFQSSPLPVSDLTCP
jgi:hypothetical protein